MGLAQQVLAIPFKRGPGHLLGYLTAEELGAILARPDRSTPKGRRDYLVLALLYDTGARVQELLDLRAADFRLDRPPLVRITGKGRKQRIVPLLPATAGLVRRHLIETGSLPKDSTPLLLNHRGQRLTRSGVSFILDHYRRLAVDGHRRPRESDQMIIIRAAGASSSSSYWAPATRLHVVGALVTDQGSQQLTGVLTSPALRRRKAPEATRSSSNP